MGEKGECARDCDTRALFRVGPSARRDGQTVPAQITVRCEWTEDVLGRADQQAPKVRIAFFGDVPLRLTLPRVVLSGNETEPSADAAAAPETLLVFEREDVRQGRERSDSADLHQRSRIGIAIFGELLDCPVERADACGELLDDLDQRQQSLTQAVWKARCGTLMKGLGGSGRNALTDRLDRRPNMLNQPPAASHECVARADDSQVALPQLASVLERAKQLRIQSGHTCQILRIHAVTLVLVLENEAQLAWVRHKHLVPQACQKPADPRRVHPCFDGNPLSGCVFEVKLDRSRCRRYSPFGDY